MRINKKALEGRTGRDKLFYKDYYSEEYFVNVGNVGQLLAMLLFIGVGLACVLWAIFGLYTFATPSKYEVALYNKQCDIIAGDKKHYVARSSAYSKNNYVCVVGPDFKDPINM